jgi:hypothetical protein
MRTIWHPRWRSGRRGMGELVRATGWSCLFVATMALRVAGQVRRAELSTADSALIGRILLAEDRRDSTDDALAEGSRHADSRVRVLARRALGRIRDPQFAARDSLPPLPAPKPWSEPPWRLRLRALTAMRSDCAALATALADSAWPVRLRAADLASAPCASDNALVAPLDAWIDALPASTATRQPGGVSWHAAAHAIVALSRLRPNDARARLGKLASHKQWQVRAYAARAAAVLSDTTHLRMLASDS